jgi:hypothetical protein
LKEISVNRKHLVLVLAGCLALSSSTLAMAEGKSKEARSKHTAHGKVLAPTTPITLGAASGIVKIDTSTAVPLIQFDTSTVVPKIQFDTSTATTHIDLESDDDGKKVEH